MVKLDVDRVIFYMLHRAAIVTAGSRRIDCPSTSTARHGEEVPFYVMQVKPQIYIFAPRSTTSSLLSESRLPSVLKVITALEETHSCSHKEACTQTLRALEQLREVVEHWLKEWVMPYSDSGHPCLVYAVAICFAQLLGSCL